MLKTSDKEKNLKSALGKKEHDIQKKIYKDECIVFLQKKVMNKKTVEHAARKQKTLKLRIQYSVMMSFQNKRDHYALTEWWKYDNTNV